MKEKQGFFLSFEGIDGSGKSTQASMLLDYLVSKGHDCSFYREPGGTSSGERIRSLLLDPSSILNPRAELLLYLAARSQITYERIKPDLDDGKIVILDRFIDSSTAYQGYARGLGRDTVEKFNDFATYGLVPDLTLFIDCDVRTSLSRLGTELDRMESEGYSFLDVVRDGFVDLLAHHPDRFVSVDGNRSVEDVFEEVLRIFRDWCPLL